MNHTRVNISNVAISCGVIGLDRISTESSDVLYAVASRLYHPSRGDPAAIVIWSDINKFETAGAMLEDRVIAEKLGELLISPPVENPRTGNIIVLYTWIINHEHFKKWYVNERIKRLKKVGA